MMYVCWAKEVYARLQPIASTVERISRRRRRRRSPRRAMTVEEGRGGRKESPRHRRGRHLLLGLEGICGYFWGIRNHHYHNVGYISRLAQNGRKGFPGPSEQKEAILHQWTAAKDGIPAQAPFALCRCHADGFHTSDMRARHVFYQKGAHGMTGRLRSPPGGISCHCRLRHVNNGRRVRAYAGPRRTSGTVPVRPSPTWLAPPWCSTGDARRKLSCYIGSHIRRGTSWGQERGREGFVWWWCLGTRGGCQTRRFSMGESLPGTWFRAVV